MLCVNVCYINTILFNEDNHLIVKENITLMLETFKIKIQTVLIGLP